MNPLGAFFSVDFILLILCAFVFYRAAQIENLPGFYWAAPSILVFFITWRLLHWGWIGDLFGQALVFLGIAAFRAWRDFRSGGPS